MLKPGGKLVLFEYSVPPRERLTRVQQAAFDLVVERSAMRGLPAFVHGRFPAILAEAGFDAVQIEDITERIWPMLRRLARLCWLPARLGRLLRAQGALLSCTAVVEGYQRLVPSTAVIGASAVTCMLAGAAALGVPALRRLPARARRAAAQGG